MTWCVSAGELVNQSCCARADGRVCWGVWRVVRLMSWSEWGGGGEVMGRWLLAGGQGTMG